MTSQSQMERQTASSLDYWTFVDQARARLTDLGVEETLPTEMLLSLNRASGTITYDLEATSHRPHGRSWACFRIMYALWVAGPCESKQLASATGMSRAAVSNLTGPLEEAGTVRRRRNAADGRSVVLELTQAGREETAQAFAIQHARETEWASGLSTIEQRELVRLLNKLMSSTHVQDLRERP